MKPHFLKPLLLLFAFALALMAEAQGAGNSSSLHFLGMDFHYRRSNEKQYEFTQKDETNLSKWNNMLTISHYPQIVYDTRLGELALGTYELYKSHGAEIISTDATPKNRNKFMEYKLVAVFHNEQFSEAVFAKFEISNRIGTSSIFSHRIYGHEVEEVMNLWILNNSGKIEAEFGKWAGPPSEFDILRIQKQ